MKLTKADYMRLPKERLAELLVERDNEIIQPIEIPEGLAKPYEPWKEHFPYGPVITYADSPNTSESHPDPNIYAQQ